MAVGMKSSEQIWAPTDRTERLDMGYGGGGKMPVSDLGMQVDGEVIP